MEREIIGALFSLIGCWYNYPLDSDWLYVYLSRLLDINLKRRETTLIGQ